MAGQGIRDRDLDLVLFLSLFIAIAHDVKYLLGYFGARRYTYSV
jgi:hypothetical protein